jgi:crotonobetainyl-CoA:carnitine CoA-transferase CaiB-like acyl-CoA transferase
MQFHSVDATPALHGALHFGFDGSENLSGPLSHIRVLDLSRIMAGPWASQVLADLGADVIKVERPGAGDDTRSWGPPFLKGPDGADTREAGYYLSVNRGKRSITLALDKPEGQRIVRALAARSDILLENYKVGTLARFGLGYEDLKAVNPKLIYCSVTGFGQTGPRRGEAAYDFLIQAMGGLMSITGERDDKPGGGPQKVGIPIVDIMTGMYAAVGMLAALARREVSGQGEFIDLGMLDVQVGFLANQAMNHLVSGSTPRRSGNAHPNIQPQDVYPCRDGAVVIVVGNDGQFARFCGAIGRPELAGDERFATNPARVRNLEALNAAIVAELARRERAYWVEAISAAGVPCGPINTIPEALADPQVEHRGMLFEMAHSSGVPLPQIANPLRFAGARLEYRSPPPLLGQHTGEVLREIGIGEAELARLRETGVV